MTTNYQKHFGDPARAARTLFEIFGKVADAVNLSDECCDFCDLFSPCGECPFENMCASEEGIAAFLGNEAVPFMEACNAVMEGYPNAMRMLEES